uniref:Casein kinase substrate phosphoprotein PP28, putative n=1 Tax=Theileria annulata TaxID=5874 RepID=A0A3B0MKJ9_THEAN
MSYKSRGSHKKFTPKGRSRYVASDDEIIARNQEILNLEQSEGSDSNDTSDDSENEVPETNTRVSNEFEPLIEVNNPNKTKNSVEKTVELSRREKEELRRQKFERDKMKLMAEGKLATAKADLAR